MLNSLRTFWQSRSLTFKIVSSIILALAVTAVPSFWITQARVHKQAEDAFLDKLKMLTAIAEGSRVSNAEGGHAWQVTQQYARAQGYLFRTPARVPNDPNDTLNPFDQRAFAALESRPDAEQYVEHDSVNGRPVLLYAKPVLVRSECQGCHTEWKTQQEGNPAAGTRHLEALFSIAAPLDVLKANQRSNAVVILLSSLGTLLLSALTVFFLVRRLIIRPLRGALELADGIAANDLTVEDLAVGSSDEMGRTAAALNLMKKNLAITLQEVVAAARKMTVSSDAMACSVLQQSEGAEQQKQRTEQVATAMHQIASTVAEVSENSNRAADASRQAAQTARSGGQVVSETLGQMRAIAASVTEAAGKVEELGKSSHQIGAIIAVIDDIADQTNLLALNAAIEAARAGEQGRGFAVVSDEVRKLAERTTQATKEITSMIAAIRSETESTVEAMHSSTGRVQQGVDSTAQAGASLQTIIEMSDRVGEMITHIATAATQQSAATEEVSSNLEQIAKITEETATGAQHCAVSVKELDGLAKNLQSLVGRFRLSSNGKPPETAQPAN
jgi:methyl-accepting chemotaxis protein